MTKAFNWTRHFHIAPQRWTAAAWEMAAHNIVRDKRWNVIYYVRKRLSQSVLWDCITVGSLSVWSSALVNDIICKQIRDEHSVLCGAPERCDCGHWRTLLHWHTKRERTRVWAASARTFIIIITRIWKMPTLHACIMRDVVRRQPIEWHVRQGRSRHILVHSKVYLGECLPFNMAHNTHMTCVYYKIIANDARSECELGCRQISHSREQIVIYFIPQWIFFLLCGNLQLFRRS